MKYETKAKATAVHKQIAKIVFPEREVNPPIFSDIFDVSHLAVGMHTHPDMGYDKYSVFVLSLVIIDDEGQVVYFKGDYFTPTGKPPYVWGEYQDWWIEVDVPPLIHKPPGVQDPRDYAEYCSGLNHLNDDLARIVTTPIPVGVRPHELVEIGGYSVYSGFLSEI